MGKYKEIDMSFYGKEKMDFIDITPNDAGYYLTWELQNEIGGYAIYRKDVSVEGWELVVTLDQNVMHYQDSKPPVDNLYEYQIYAVIEGDLILGEPDNAGGVDLGLTTNYESAEQDAMNRIRTQKGDWRSHENIGADMELLEGEPNTKATGIRGEESIHETLTYDGRFMREDITVKAVPTSIDQIDFYTVVDSDADDPIIVKSPQTI
ncbi:hypothetical protein [Virgibacillus salexigens]|nr:hypothetical protein [Virgibacillus massiliensis]